MSVEKLLKCGIIFLVLILSISAKKVKSEGQVVIGILTLPSYFPEYPYQSYSQIVKAYVQYIQYSNEAIAVPIHWDSSEEALEDILSKVNGVFLTGGPVQFMEKNSLEQKYLSTVTYITEYAMRSTDDDDYFPVWGTCLGFQVLNYIAANNDLSIMKRKLGDEGNHGLFDINEESKLFGGMRSELLDWFSESEPAFFSHDDGIIKEQAEENEEISDNVTFTSFSRTSNGVEFVASMEFDDYPIYAVQFHPEKNMFEPKVDAQRDEKTIEISKYFIDFFISECRENDHSFEDESEIQYLRIDNLKDVDIQSSYYSSLYFLKNKGNSNVNYNDRFGFRHLLHKKAKKNHGKQKVIN